MDLMVAGIMPASMAAAAVGGDRREGRYAALRLCKA